ncbi:MAG: DnaA/Hda family protein [Xanthomonadales bacterium]|nr:DnaA/Hda family protein [Xanthomonadales bacterium]
MTLPAQQLLLPLDRAEESVFGQFVGNSGVVSTLQAVARGGLQTWCYLKAGVGQGKTHLLMATCHLASDARRRCGLLTAESLVEAGPECLAGLNGVDLVALDDFDRLAGRADWAEPLFHCFNAWRDQGTVVLAAGQQPIRGIDTPLPDLASRLQGMTELRLDPLSEDDRAELLRRRSSRRDVPLSEEVIGYLLRRQARDPASLVGLVNELQDASLAVKRRLTVPLARQILEQRKPNDLST